MARSEPRPARKRWRLTFDGDGAGNVHVLTISKDDPGSINDAVAIIRGKLRGAMEAGGCRSVSFGVHVEGEACDHEVGP